MFVIFVNEAMSTENTEFDLAVLIFALLLRQRVFLFLTFQLCLSLSFRFFLSPSFLLLCLSLLPICSLPAPSSFLLFSPPSLLDWWSKHRKRAGSVPPRQSWAWAFLQRSCAGVKSLLWFSFHLSTANQSTTLQSLNSDPCKEFQSKDGLMPFSQLWTLLYPSIPLTTSFF